MTSSKQKLKPYFLVLLACISTVFCLYWIFDAGNIHFLPYYLIDQISYITQGRHLSDFGHLFIHGKYEGMGSTIFPSMLLSGHSRTHMPGYIAMMALSYKLFAFNGFTSILPNIISYIGSTLLIFTIGNKLYDQRVGMWAALTFLFLPVCQIFGLSAMMEMSITFACLSAFTLLLFIPSRWQAFAIPVLIGAAYLFRQSSVMLLIPMLGYYQDRQYKPKILHALAIAIGTIAVCNLIGLWQIHYGLHVIPYRNILYSGHISYDNAYPLLSQAGQANFIALISQLFIHFYFNIISLINDFSTIRLNSQFPLQISAILFALFTLTASIDGLRQYKKNWLPLSCGLLALCVIGADVVIYNGKIQYILRLSFFTIPFVLLQSARVILQTSIRKKALFAGFFVYALFSIFIATQAAHSIKKQHATMIENCQFYEGIHPDAKNLLVTDPTLTALYNYRHYPEMDAFVPANRKTLLLLNKQYPIGTVVISPDELKTKINEKDINDIGLHFVGKRHLRHQVFLVYKRGPGETS